MVRVPDHPARLQDEALILPLRSQTDRPVELELEVIFADHPDPGNGACRRHHRRIPWRRSWRVGPGLHRGWGL